MGLSRGDSDLAGVIRRLLQCLCWREKRCLDVMGDVIVLIRILNDHPLPRAEGQSGQFDQGDRPERLSHVNSYPDKTNICLDGGDGGALEGEQPGETSCEPSRRDESVGRPNPPIINGTSLSIFLSTVISCRHVRHDYQYYSWVLLPFPVASA